MSQQIPEQPNIGNYKAVAVYPTQKAAETAIRELERFEKTVHREQNLPHRETRGAIAASGREY
ncbi:MAG: hypothetical protein ACYC64_05045 [Armatimonadota bacterium]